MFEVSWHRLLLGPSLGLGIDFASLAIALAINPFVLPKCRPSHRKVDVREDPTAALGTRLLNSGCPCRYRNQHRADETNAPLSAAIVDEGHSL